MWTHSNIAQTACFQVIATQEGDLPIDPIKTIYRRGWELYTYEYLSNLIDCPLQKLLSISNDAFSYYDSTKKTYVIVYNENMPENRVRFSLAHEIGHIVLRHFSEDSSFVLSFNENYFHIPDSELPYLEKAADIFAANFLAPAPLLDMCNLDEEDISRIFKISLKSATYRRAGARYDSNSIPSPIKQSIRIKFGRALRSYYFKNYPFSI